MTTPDIAERLSARIDACELDADTEQAMLDAIAELERLRAQVAPTDEQIIAGARALNKIIAEACSVNEADHWATYGNSQIIDAATILHAAFATSPAAPAQQAEPAKVQGLTDEQIVMDGLMMCPNRSLRDCAAAFEQGARWAERTCATAWGVKLENSHD